VEFCPAIFRRIRTALFFVIVAACHSCGSVNHAKLPIGYVDVPAPGRPAVFEGNSLVQGWALSDEGIREITLYVDRQYVSSAQTGISRPDVAAAFPKEPHALDSGWRATIDVTNLAVGAHDVVVQAIGKNGARRDIAAFPARVVK
jgi:hypothetical protein